MTTKTDKPQSERQKKLANALRQNLLKRKQQQRERLVYSDDLEKKIKNDTGIINILNKDGIN